MLHRLVQLAIDHAGHNLGLANGQLEAFTTHLLHEDGQSQFATALDFPSVGTLGGENLQGHVTDEFLVKAVLDLACCHLVALDAAGDR